MSDFKTDAIICLSKFFHKALIDSKFSMRDFEDYVNEQGTQILAQATNSALEMFDNMLNTQCSQDLRVKERRVRNLASTVGDLKFSRHIYEDKYKNSISLLDWH